MIEPGCWVALYVRTHALIHIHIHTRPDPTAHSPRWVTSPRYGTRSELFACPSPAPPEPLRRTDDHPTISMVVVLRGLERSKVRAAALTAALSWAPFALGKRGVSAGGCWGGGRHVEPETHWNKWRCLFVYITCQLFSLSSGFPAALGEVGRGGACLAVGSDGCRFGTFALRSDRDAQLFCEFLFTCCLFRTDTGYRRWVQELEETQPPQRRDRTASPVYTCERQRTKQNKKDYYAHDWIRYVTSKKYKTVTHSTAFPPSPCLLISQSQRIQNRRSHQ